MALRIAEISTLARPVPPAGEGSIELLVSILTEGLVDRGHEVTLFALADSRTRAALRSPVLTSYCRDSTKWDWQLYEAYQVSRVFQEAEKFDIIHCHSYHFGLLFCDYTPVPSLHSIHVLPGMDYAFLARNTRNRHIHCCSDFQARSFGGLDGIHVIPHGLDLSRFRPAEPEGYMAFLGRFLPDKGPLQAIELARRQAFPLKLAAPHNAYFEEVLRPRLVPGLIEYVGELDERGKADFLSRANLLLYPVQREEPFGLVLIEAMACGVPVVAMDKGAVREVVLHGETGWLCQTPADLDAGIIRVGSLDRSAIRRYAEEKFSARVMVDRVESLLTDICAKRQSS